MNTIRIMYLYSVKGLFNRLGQHPFKMFLILTVAASILFIPAYFLGNQTGDGFIPYQWIVLLSSALFARFGIKLAVKESDFKAIPQEFTFILATVPEKIKKLYNILIIDTILKSCISYITLYIVFYLYSGGRARFLFLNIIIVLLLISFVTFLSGIISILSTYAVPLVLRLFSFSVSFFLVVTGIFVFLNHRKYQVFDYMINFVFADILDFLLKSNYTIRQYIQMLAITFLILIITVIVYYVLLLKSKLKAFHILEVDYINKIHKKGNLLLKVSSKLYFLPEKMQLLISKELVQIWRERLPLYSVILQSALAGIIMIISAKTFEGNLVQLGVMVVLAYEAFLLALFSVPRELRTIWILKIMAPNWNLIAGCKFIACYIGAIVMSIPIFIIYTIATYFIVQVSPFVYIDAYMGGLFTIIPLSIGLGFIMTAFIPFDVMDKKKKVTYKFNGLEGAMLFILVFLAVVPTWLMMQNRSNWIIVLIFILYFIIFLLVGLLCAKSKLRKL